MHKNFQYLYIKITNIFNSVNDLGTSNLIM